MSITLRVNTILDGKWITAGEPLPFKSVNEPGFPKFLKAYITEPEVEEPSPQEQQLNFKLNQRYGVDEDGRLRGRRRNLEREAAELAQQAMEQDAIEDELEAPLDPVTAAAMEVVQDDHDANVGQQIAEAEYKAKEREATNEAAEEFLREQHEENGDPDADEFVSPTVDVAPPKPKRKLRQRFVKRGIAWRRVEDSDLKVKKGESVFVRNGPGRYEDIGEVGSDHSLPEIWVELKGEIK